MGLGCVLDLFWLERSVSQCIVADRFPCFIPLQTLKHHILQIVPCIAILVMAIAILASLAVCVLSCESTWLHLIGVCQILVVDWMPQRLNALRMLVKQRVVPVLEYSFVVTGVVVLLYLLRLDLLSLGLLRLDLLRLDLLCLVLELLNLKLVDVLADLFGQELLKLLSNAVFVREIASQLIWIVSFPDQDVVIVAVANLNSESQDFLLAVWLRGRAQWGIFAIYLPWEAKLFKELLL